MKEFKKQSMQNSERKFDLNNESEFVNFLIIILTVIELLNGFKKKKQDWMCEFSQQYFGKNA